MVSQVHTYSQSLASTSLQNIFASVDSSSCPNLLNFHLHTVHSDGKMQPNDLIEQAIALQVSHISITDHHSVSGYRSAQAYLQKYADKNPHTQLPKLWIGVEMNASLLFTEVHILGYDFDPAHVAMQPYLQGKTTAGIDYQAVSVISALHRAGGLAVLAHPVRYRRSPEELIPAAALLGIDGVETYYGYDNAEPWRPSPKQTDKVKKLGDRYNLLHTCGTDSHGLKISKRI
jgi:predicted metal-dependent phosphoesterase TrpH